MSLTSYSPADLAKLPRWEKVALLNRLQPKEKASETTTADLTAYRNDPVGFCRDILGVEPWERQREIMQAVQANRRVTVRSCHHSGKTFCAGALAQWWVRCFDPSLVVTTAPTMRQVKELLWYEIAQHQRRAHLPGTLNTMDLTVLPSQRAVGLTTNEPERFQGLHAANILVIVDEASGIDESIYEAIEGILTGPNAKLLLIGNPNSPSGTFFQSHQSVLYRPFHISAFDVPEHLLPPHWREERLIEWGEDNAAYQVRVLGEFPDQGDDSLIALRWVTAAQERSLEAAGPVEIGLDVARYGLDESVLYVRQGPVVLACEHWRGQDTVETAGRTVAAARRYGAQTVKVDAIGIGAGPFDQIQAALKESCSGVVAVEVNVGNKANDPENYFNLRSEMFQGLADRFKAGEISLPGEDPTLLAQLCALKKQFTPKGQMRLESKDDLRKRLPKMGSPDRADALAIAMHQGANRWVPVSGPAPVFEPKRLW